MLFERAFCNAPVCTPSRQSLITGKLPHAIGVTQLATRLSEEVLTMADWLDDLDYETLAIGNCYLDKARQDPAKKLDYRNAFDPD